MRKKEKKGEDSFFASRSSVLQSPRDKAMIEMVAGVGTILT